MGYFFGALNRLEKARNLETGKGALYQYNGLGHRIGRQEGKPTEPSLPTEQLANLTIDPTRQVEDILDLTKGYHNLLARIEDGDTTAYTWDYQVTGMSSKEGSFDYLQDEMGSPIRLLDSEGATRGLYGYEEFGTEIDELAIQGNIVQPFTYTGYQKDAITGTYYAQAREYRPEAGSFISEDIVGGFSEYPFTQNHYVYCWNQPLVLGDDDGEWPTVVVGAIVGGLVSFAAETVKQVASGEKVDVKKIALETVKGAAKGAVAGTGIGLIASAGANAGIDAIGNIAEQTLVEGKSINQVNLAETAETAIWSAGETLVFGGIGKGIGYVKNKVGINSSSTSIKLIQSKKTSGTGNKVNEYIDDISKKISSLSKNVEWRQITEKVAKYTNKKQVLHKSLKKQSDNEGEKCFYVEK